MSRNDVLRSTAAPSEMPRQSVDQLYQELGFDIPVETVPLPSGGKTYPENHPLHMRDSVSIRAMTAREEDILTSRALVKDGRMLSMLIESCMIDKGVDASTLLSGDRNAIVTAIRITGYGSEYRTNMDCPMCGTHNTHTCNLTDLPVRRLIIDPVSPGLNEFPMTLPYTGKNVTVRFTDGRDEKEAALISERKSKQGLMLDNLVTDRLFRAVVSVEGNSDKSFIRKFVNNLPASDSRSIRSFLDDNEPSIDMTTTFTCSHCEYEKEVPLPVGANFLWPGSE